MKLSKVEKIELTPEEDIQICQFLRTIDLIINSAEDTILVADAVNLWENLSDFREKHFIKRKEQ